MATKMEAALSQVGRSFGFDPEESQHHFVVTIPRGANQEIEISEHYTWSEQVGSSMTTLAGQDDGQVRSLLARTKWDAIADEVRAVLNGRLRKLGRRQGTWKVGKNLVRRELGKELVLLAWAIEEADPGLIPNAVANWQGLVPEERWWLYTQTAAATGHAIRDRGKGWRKAVRFALTENPVGLRAKDQAVVPEFFRIAAERSEQRPLFDLDLDEAATE
jgi:hypothetical protein